MRYGLQKLWINLRWGTGWGLFMGAGYCAIALVLYVLRGPGLFAKYGVTPTAAMLTYLIGGISGGWIIGLLRPLAKWRLGAIFMGICVGIVVYGLATVSMFGPISHWDRDDWIMVTILGTFTGVIGGNWFWEKEVWPTLPLPPTSADARKPRKLFQRWRPFVFTTGASAETANEI